MMTSDAVFAERLAAKRQFSQAGYTRQIEEQRLANHANQSHLRNLFRRKFLRSSCATTEAEVKRS